MQRFHFQGNFLFFKEIFPLKLSFKEKRGIKEILKNLKKFKEFYGFKKIFLAIIHFVL